jgi:general secretion pathway protein D
LSYKTVTAGGDLSLVLEALKTIGDTKVISNPQISVEDGPEAEIKVVRDQPYRLLQYESGSTNVIAVNYQFVEIGVVLKVTAKINDEKFITVDIKATISDLVDWYDYSPGNEGLVGIPVVKKSEASTTVSVKDGVTIIIGGMIKEEKRKTEAGIPILRSIPLVGRLFRSTVERKKRIETIVFLTPRIITGEEQFLQISKTKKQLKLRKTSAGSDSSQLSQKRMKIRSTE